MTYKLEPVIWSHDTGQRILCFDRCQLIITWISNINEVHGKPRLHVSVNLLFGVWPPYCATPSSSLSSSPPSWVRATSNTASHDNHEKINSWVSFSFLYEYGAPLGGPSGCQSSAIKSIKGDQQKAKALLFNTLYFQDLELSTTCIHCILNSLFLST